MEPGQDQTHETPGSAVRHPSVVRPIADWLCGLAEIKLRLAAKELISYERQTSVTIVVTLWHVLIKYGRLYVCEQ